MPTGCVVFFDRVRNFGFIAPDEGGQDLFVHQRHLANRDNLKAEDRVSYELGVDSKGKTHADRVRAI